MRPLALLVTTAVLLVSGCGTSTSETTGAAGTSGAGRQADFSFTAETVDEITFEGSSLEGRPAVLWFWSPWCPTCRAQSPNVSTLADEYAGEVAVIGVGGLDDAAAIRDLAAEIPHVTHVVDEAGEVWKHFRVTEQSSYVVIDAEGEIVAEQYLDDDELNDLVGRLAADSS